MNNVVKSEEDIACSGKQVEKNIRLDLSDISAGTIGKANITGIEIVNNETQDVIFNGKKVATISDKGIDFHIPVMIDGVEVGEFKSIELDLTANTISDIFVSDMARMIKKSSLKETRARGVV